MGIPDHRLPERPSRQSEERLAAVARMAADAIISFSDLPLKLAVLAGSLLACVGLLLTCLLVIQKLYFVEMRPGYTSRSPVSTPCASLRWVGRRRPRQTCCDWARPSGALPAMATKSAAADARAGPA